MAKEVKQAIKPDNIDINIGFYSTNGTSEKDYILYAHLIPYKYSYFVKKIFTNREEAHNKPVFLGTFDRNIADDFVVSIYVIHKKLNIQSNIKVTTISLADYESGKNTICVNAIVEVTPSSADIAAKTRIIIDTGYPLL